MTKTNLSRTALAAALCAALAAHGHALAQAQAQASDPAPTVLVTATRTPQSAANLISDASVVERERLSSTAQGSLADQLALEPGVELYSNGGPASVTGLFLRGANPSQTLTLVEGFRIGSANVGSPTFAGLPPTRFERAEVLRGPASALYGADAIGGAVQLFLPRGAGPLSFFGDAGLGTWNTRMLNAGVQGGSERGDFAVSVGHASSDGFNATSPGSYYFNPDRDGYERRNASANLNLRLAPGHQLGLVAFADRLESRFDEGDQLPDARTIQRSQLLGLHSSHALAASTTLRLRVGETRDRSENVSIFPGGFETAQRQAGADLEWRASDAVTLVTGYERLDQDVSSSSYAAGAPRSRTTDSLRASMFVNLRPHIVQLAVRHDDNSQYGARTTGLAGYGYRLTDKLRVAANVSTGFRAPSFNELYYPGYGRDALRPETSRNAEIGAYWNSGDASAQAVVYRNRVENLIVYAPVCPDPSPAFEFGCADNVNRALLEGLSLAWAQRVGAWRLRASADFQRPTDETLDKRLVRRAARHGVLAADRAIGGGSVGAEWVLSGARYEDAANTQRLGGFGLLNLRAQMPVSRDLAVFARLNNVLDKRYETAQLFTMPGANLFVGVRYQPH